MESRKGEAWRQEKERMELDWAELNEIGLDELKRKRARERERVSSLVSSSS